MTCWVIWLDQVKKINLGCSKDNFTCYTLFRVFGAPFIISYLLPFEVENDRRKSLNYNTNIYDPIPPLHLHLQKCKFDLFYGLFNYSDRSSGYIACPKSVILQAPPPLFVL